MINLRSEILALFDSLNCSHYERNGEIWVITPEMLLYRLSLPQNMTGQFLTRDLHDWVCAVCHPDAEIRGNNIGAPDVPKTRLDKYIKELESR